MPKEIYLSKAQIFAEILYDLLQKPNGIPIESLKSSYQLSDRNFRYYFDDLKDLPALKDEQGKAGICIEKEGNARYLKLKKYSKDTDETSSFFASFYMASSLMKFLSNTKLYEPIQNWTSSLKKKGLNL